MQNVLPHLDCRFQCGVFHTDNLSGAQAPRRGKPLVGFGCQCEQSRWFPFFCPELYLPSMESILHKTTTQNINLCKTSYFVSRRFVHTRNSALVLTTHNSRRACELPSWDNRNSLSKNHCPILKALRWVFTRKRCPPLENHYALGKTITRNLKLFEQFRCPILEGTHLCSYSDSLSNSFLFITTVIIIPVTMDII